MAAALLPSLDVEIDGTRILLTGASGGLGAAMARTLAERGARLVLSARRADVLADLAAETGGEVVVADLAERGDVDRLCELVRDVDVLVANAGVGGNGSVRDLTPADVDAVLDVNLRAPAQLAVAFAQASLELPRTGQIVLIGSVSGLVATPATSLYNMTKFGLRGFSHALRLDLVGTGIGVTHIAPGFIRDAGMFAQSEIQLPPGVRTRSPEDVAAAVVRAIETDPAELVVAPAELRIAGAFGSLAPGVTDIIQQWVGTAAIADRGRP